MVVVSDELMQMIQGNYNPEHGVVNMRSVINALKERGADAVESLLNLYEKRDCPVNMRFSAFVGLMALTASAELSESQAERLAATEDGLCGFCGDAEYLYRFMNALGSSQKYAFLLVKLAEKFFQEKKHPEWRWLGFYALSTLLGNKRTFQLTRSFLSTIELEAMKEEDKLQRNQLIFLAGRVWENQKMY